MKHIRIDMSNWSSHSRNPTKIWKILSKENPNLEKSYFLLSNGSWNIARLNEALSVHEENNMKKAKLTNQFQQSASVQQTQQIQTRQVMVQMAKPNKVNFNMFNTAMAFYF